MNRSIQTFSGRLVDPFDLQPDAVQIIDIAHGLACTNRFTGASDFPVSVAQHSLLVLRLVEEEVAKRTRCGTPSTYDFLDSWRFRALPLAALLHDASEAYLCDLPRPLKEHSGVGALYKEIEAKVQRVIETHFELPEEIFDDEIIHTADMRACVTEARDTGMLAKAERTWDLARAFTPYGEPGEIRPRGWHDAERAFLDAYRRLIKARRA